MEVLGKFVGLFIVIFIAAIIFTIPTYLFWNWLMPVIFGVTKITFFQAWGINALSFCLFKDSGIKV